MTDETPGEPAEQRIIQFYDDELAAVRLTTGEIFVPVRRLCENLGLDWRSQLARIDRDEVLSEAKQGVVMMTTPSPDARGGGPQEAQCLPLDLIPGWLFGIQTSRVREEIRPKLVRYRRECFRVLWDAFKGDILPTMDPALTPPAEEMTLAERALVHAEALFNLAKQQVTLERWVMQHDNRLAAVEDTALAAHERLDKAAEVVKALQLRVYGPYEVISEDQAAELSALVKTIAHTMSQHDPGKNHYQAIWSELHRRYNVTSYRRVPAAKFGDVVSWLEDYLASLAGES